MPYTPSKPTGDAVSGIQSALDAHHEGIRNVERGSDVQRRIMSGYDSSGNRKTTPPTSAQDDWANSIRSSVAKGKSWLGTVQQGMDMLKRDGS